MTLDEYNEEKAVFDNADQQELEPCPWCGKQEFDLPELWHETKTPTPYYVLCTNCLARSPAATTADKAIKEWNKR